MKAARPLNADTHHIIAETTVKNIIEITQNGQCPNELCYRCGSAEDCKNGKCF